MTLESSARTTAPPVVRGGKLTRDRFAFSMPVDAPLYQSPPFYYRDTEGITIVYETDEEAALDLLPQGLELPLPATAGVTVVRYPFSTFGPYDEAILGLSCLWQGQPRSYVAHILVTTEPPLAAGREIWGYPKKLAHIELRKENDLILGVVERPRGLRLCTAVMRPQEPVELTDQRGGSIALRVIPSPEEGAGPSLAQLIDVASQRQVKAMWQGPGSVSFDTPSALDPWYKLPVRRVLRAYYTRSDLVLGHGSIVKTY